MNAAPPIYLDQAYPAAARLLSALDREPDSVTYGSLDREHWCWKFRDFPLGMLQSAIYPLALLWRHPLPGNPYVGNPRLLEWISAAMRALLARQHGNGAVDAFAPNDQDPGVTLFAAYQLAAAVRLLGAELSPDVRSTALNGIRRACNFSLPREETHGFVSNHWALFALAYQDAFELLGDARYRDRCEGIVGRIISEQSRDGWYREYEGPDPGYESLGIFYLALLWQRTRSAQLLDSLRRSVAVYSHFVHSDGSVGGVYGSRHTSLFFPGGFEILAGEIPLAASVACFMRERLANGNVLTLAVVDAENLGPLLPSYLEAALNHAQAAAGPPLPCEQNRIDRHFDESGIRVVGNASYYAVVHTKKGGVCRIFDKRTEKVAYEDAGYLVRSGGRTWCAQRMGLSKPLPQSDAQECSCEGGLVELRQMVPTPLRFMVLRLLNLTAFRSPRLGQWIRDRIVRMLILQKHHGPFHVRRTVRFAPEAIHFVDQLESLRSMQVSEVRLPRSLATIHMGSAKYFHRNELAAIAAPPVGEMAAQLSHQGRASMEFQVIFPANQDSRVVWSDVHTASVEELTRA